MGRIDKKEYIRLLILWILFCAGIIISAHFQKAIFIILSSICLGLLIVGVIVSYKKDGWKANFEFIIATILAIVSIASVIIEPPILDRLDHCYFNKVTVNFNDYIGDGHLQNHKFIFAIDNSGGYLNSPSFYNNNITRSEILKLQLEDDLTKILNENDKTNDFVIKMIGKPENYNFNENEWVELVEDRVKQEISSINELKPENNISDFYGFYKAISNICKDNSYTLFIYSDFIYDLTKGITNPGKIKRKELDKKVKNIRIFQKKLEKRKVTRNYYYFPISKLQKDERNVLPINNTTYLNLYDISCLSQQEQIAQNVEETNNLPFFHFKDVHKTRSSLRVNFNSNGNYIVDIDEQFIIYDGYRTNNDEYEFHMDNPNSLNNKTAEIVYRNSRPPEDLPRIKIIQNNKHYLSTCNFEENKDHLWRLWYFLIGLFISFAFGAIINRVWIK